MGVRISREAPLGPGTRSFRFENVADRVHDQKQYEEGRISEEGRFHTGSLAQRVFDILSTGKEPNPPRHSDAAQQTPSSEANQAKQSAA
jgi:hypothetical protein